MRICTVIDYSIRFSLNADMQLVQNKSKEKTHAWGVHVPALFSYSRGVLWAESEVAASSKSRGRGRVRTKTLPALLSVGVSTSKPSGSECVLPLDTAFLFSFRSFTDFSDTFGADIISVTPITVPPTLTFSLNLHCLANDGHYQNKPRRPHWWHIPKMISNKNKII